MIINKYANTTECPQLRFLQNKVSYGSNINTVTGPRGSAGGEMPSHGRSFMLLYVKFVVKEGAITMTPLLHTNLLPARDVCGNPDQTADYSVISIFKLGASSLSAQSADRGVK